MRFQSESILLLVLVGFLPAMAGAQMVPVGGEFQVNTQTIDDEGTRYGPRVGAAADGSFVVSWASEPSYSTAARRFGSSGAPLGTEFEIVPPLSYRPALAVAPNGEFTIAWEEPDADQFGVFARRFSTTGSQLGAEVQVNTYVTEDQHFQVAAADGMGNVLVAWESPLQDGERRGVFAQRYDSSGAAAGTEFQVNSYTFGHQNGQVVAGDPAGGFVVGWSDYRYDGILPRTFARRYDASGSPQGNEFQVNAYTTCGLGAGDYGLSIGPNGGLVAVYDCVGRDGHSAGIFGRRFASSGAPVGTEFQVNSYTRNDQYDPEVAHDERDGFAVTWYSDHDNYDFNIFVRRYESSGAPSGREFLVNSFTPADQAYPQIASLPDGEFVVAWMSEQQDGYLNSVFARRMRPLGEPLTGKTLVIKNPPAGPTKNKLVLVSKDPAIETPQGVAGDPRCAPLGSGSAPVGASLRVVGAGGDFTIDLPCAAWVADAGRTKFTYRDSSGATCKRVTISDGRLLKAVCSGAQVDYALGAAQENVAVSLTTGDPLGKYCMEFGTETSANVLKDGSNGRVYKARDAAPSAFCR